MSSESEPRELRARALPLWCLPWIVYLAVTVLAPAVNGAWRNTQFGAHALATIGVVGALVAARWGIQRACSRAVPHAAGAPAKES